LKRSTLFVVTIQVTFVVIAVVAAVSFYDMQKLDGSLEPTASASPSKSAAASPLTPEQAAQVAAQYLGRGDIYSVEFAILNGVNSFKVIFSSGEWLYISSDGQVIPVIVGPTIVDQNLSQANGGK
jgi:hypothetical protein